MIFIDGEAWPPSFHGTGSEEVFGGGACPNTEYQGPYAGYHIVANPDFKGKNAMYRFFVADPVRFQKSIRVTIEHGHANDLSNDYSSTAFWYQQEPHAPFPALPPAEERRPHKGDDTHECAFEVAEKLRGTILAVLAFERQGKMTLTEEEKIELFKDMNEGPRMLEERKFAELIEKAERQIEELKQQAIDAGALPPEEKQ